ADGDRDRLRHHRAAARAHRGAVPPPPQRRPRRPVARGGRRVGARRGRGARAGRVARRRGPRPRRRPRGGGPVALIAVPLIVLWLSGLALALLDGRRRPVGVAALVAVGAAFALQCVLLVRVLSDGPQDL